MAAASNESFGLKIATASSIALTVLLLISVYFLNSNYNLELEKRVASEKKVSELTTSNRVTTEQANSYRTLLGYGPVEDYDLAMASLKKDDDQRKSDVQAINTEVASTITEFQKKAGAKNIDASQFAALQTRTSELVDSFVNNADQSKKASLDRIKDLLTNQVKIAAALELHYADIKHNLDQANKVNDSAKKVVEANLASTRAELDSTIKTDEASRQELVASIRATKDELNTTEIKLANLINTSNGSLEDKQKRIDEMRSMLRDIRNIQGQTAEVMSKSGGRVTFVDYGSKTVRVNVNRRQGVRPLMQFTIFDKNAAGITSDKPKGLIELVKVGDPARGESDSEARILKTYESTNPIRYNDNIFSVGWSYDHPQRFDLVGKIDINRDGRDDRGDLIRMIEASGGVIEYDLPPPNVDRAPGQAAVARAYARLGQPVPAVTGRAAGKISALSFAYVVDRRQSTVLFAAKGADPTKEDTAFLEEESMAIREASDQAVRPLPLEKLLNMLGYDYSMPIEGRREAVDKSSINELLKPVSKPVAPAPSDN